MKIFVENRRYCYFCVLLLELRCTKNQHVEYFTAQYKLQTLIVVLQKRRPEIRKIEEETNKILYKFSLVIALELVEK